MDSSLLTLDAAAAAIKESLPDGYSIEVQNLCGPAETVCVFFRDEPCEDFLNGTLSQKLGHALHWAIADSKETNDAK